MPRYDVFLEGRTESSTCYFGVAVMNCQFCEDYEWSKKHRPKTGRELYTKYYVCLYERTLRKGCGLTSTYTHKRRPLNFCPECGRQLKKTKKEDET